MLNGEYRTESQESRTKNQELKLEFVDKAMSGKLVMWWCGDVKDMIIKFAYRAI